MKTQITSTILGLVLGLAVGSNFACAGEFFLDDFAEPHPTNPDREPSYKLEWGNEMVIENGNLIIGDTDPTIVGLLAGAFVEEFSTQDVSLEARFQIVAGSNAGVCFLPTGVCGHVSSSSAPSGPHPSGPLQARLTQWAGYLAPPVSVDFDPLEEDVVVRLQALGDQLSLWVWPADGTKATQPLVTATKPAGLTNDIGVVVDNYNATFSRTEFRYFAADPSVLGDFNSDGSLDNRDIDLLCAAVRDGLHPKWFDVNDNDLVNEDDHEFWVHDLKNTWLGDADLNGEFNSSDLVQVFAAGKYETGEDAGWAEGDWNADLKFNSSDMVAAFVDGGYEKGLRTVAVAVPEPTSVLLLMAGLIYIAIRRRRFDP